MKFKFEKRDAWIGLFWDRIPGGLRFYLCLIPFFPIIWEVKTRKRYALLIAPNKETILEVSEDGTVRELNEKGEHETR